MECNLVIRFALSACVSRTLKLSKLNKVKEILFCSTITTNGVMQKGGPELNILNSFVMRPAA